MPPRASGGIPLGRRCSKQLFKILIVEIFNINKINIHITKDESARRGPLRFTVKFQFQDGNNYSGSITRATEFLKPTSVINPSSELHPYYLYFISYSLHLEAVELEPRAACRVTYEPRQQ